MNTYANAATSYAAPDFKQLRELMQQMDAKRRARDEARDVAFAEMRERGEYIKVEKIGGREVWVVGDDLLAKIIINTIGDPSPVGAPCSLYGVWVMSLSEWVERQKHEADDEH